MEKPRYCKLELHRNRANVKAFIFHFRVIEIEFDTFFRLPEKPCPFPDKNAKLFWVDKQSER